MRIIGLTAPIGHGKSSFAEAILELEPQARLVESGEVIAEVADILNQDLRFWPELRLSGNTDNWATWLSTSLATAIETTTTQQPESGALVFDETDLRDWPADFQKLNHYRQVVGDVPQLLEEPITSVNKEAYRPFLQWIGGYVTNRLGYSLWYEELVQRGRQAAADGCPLLMVGGVRFPADAAVLRRERATIIDLYRPNIAVADIDDPTEVQRTKISADTHIINDASLPQLKKVAAVILEDLRTDSLVGLYQAQAF